MAVHKLILDDLQCASYQLIAIHCSLEDYRVAYLLNKHLNLRLRRRASDLDVSTAYYPMFEWEDLNKMLTWSLVSNQCRLEDHKETKDASSLFGSGGRIKTYHLIPEHKEANYLLKTDQELGASKEKRTIEVLLSIPQIVTAYSIDVNNLKSKTNLIFN